MRLGAIQANLDKRIRKRPANMSERRSFIFGQLSGLNHIIIIALNLNLNLKPNLKLNLNPSLNPNLNTNTNTSASTNTNTNTNLNLNLNLKRTLFIFVKLAELANPSPDVIRAGAG